MRLILASLLIPMSCAIANAQGAQSIAGFPVKGNYSRISGSNGSESRTETPLSITNPRDLERYVIGKVDPSCHDRQAVISGRSFHFSVSCNKSASIPIPFKQVVSGSYSGTSLNLVMDTTLLGRTKRTTINYKLLRRL